MTGSPSARIVRGAEAAPFEFPAVGTPAATASGFVAWGAPADDSETAREEDRRAAYEEGVRDGRAEAEATCQEQMGALRAEMEQAEAAHAAADAEAQKRIQATAETLSNEWSEAVRALEPRLVEFALQVATRMLGAPPSEAARMAGVQALSEAVDTLADGNPTTITLHPVDLLEHQESGFADTLSGAHTLLRWEPDSTLTPGDWIVSTPEAAVRRITSEALAALRDRLGMGAP
ncbi:MAG: FliH/SctL family protein [Bacteroidota bacterium]